ncbi:MAG: DUF433 domain-containing protein [Planctomycetota bacterium]|nr:DUF433 domain-containing protein [Planctomycetota bacterium]MDA1138017.1 DUF433 domain-containing protein [Planctomycetota bacterium]
MALVENLVALPPPIKKDEGGVFRVGGTRVRLDTVIAAFNTGSSPDEILSKYPSLELADVYSVVTYYLWHRDEIDAYLEEQGKVSKSVRESNERRFPPDGIREKLLARKLVEDQ